MGDAGFCTGCGKPLAEGTRFCAACGVPVERPSLVVAQPIVAPAQQTPASAQPTAAAVATHIQRGATIAAAVAGTPWQTIVAGDASALGDYARRWAPMLVGALGRPNLRVPARALLLTVTLDVVVAIMSGQPAALKALGWRLFFGLGTAFWGLVAGRKRGFASKLTQLLSLVTSGFQVVSVVRGLIALFAGPVALLPMLSSLLVQVASLVALVKTFLFARRKK